MNSNSQSDDPSLIAIIGIGCRFPGGADTPASFWFNLESGVDAITEVPADRWVANAFYDTDRDRPGKVYSRWGGFVRHIDQFDARFFGIAPREAAAMDPQQRLLLETAWEALEDAGVVAEELAGSAVGVFVGISSGDYGQLLGAPSERGIRNSYKALGSTLCIAANRISFAFDFRGPSLAVDTACSSSLVALDLACHSLRRGESRLALVGGVNLNLKPETTISFCAASMLSPDGRCRSFDARANGYVRAEGAGVVVLKPLRDAIRDGDRVYAVVLGTAVNQDGHSKGITVPNPAAQEALLREACASAGVEPTEIDYVEAHGTGTPVGDPIEANAIGAVVGRGRTGRQCVLGSVKSNIGHLEAGAGIAGIIKVALAIHHQRIPGNVHFQSPNPQIDFDGLNLRVPITAEPWPVGPAGRRLAGVNSFGFGGTNAHAILTDPPAPDHHSVPAGHPGFHLLPVSARSPESLTALVVGWADRSEDNETSVADLAYTAGVRRSHHPYRLAVVSDTFSNLGRDLRSHIDRDTPPTVIANRIPIGGPPPVVFVFTGMGPQWWAMGRQLLTAEPIYRAMVEECDRLLRPLTGWSLVDELLADEAKSRINEAFIAQPAIFAVQVGLAAVWAAWGVRPDAVVGHSVGEVAAAYVSGALSLEDAIRVVFHRSRLQDRTRGQGGMLAVGLPVAEVETLLPPDGVSVAAVNSPRSVTLAGDPDGLERIRLALTGGGTFCRLLNVDVPYHSPLMGPLREELITSLKGIEPQTPATPLFSTVTGGRIDGPIVGSHYWWRNVREPVRFAEAVESLIATLDPVFVEIGPHPVLAQSIKECAADRPVTVISSLNRKEDDRKALLMSLGKLYVLGRPIHWPGLHPRGGMLVSLPPYPWNRQRHWLESPEGQRVRLGLSTELDTGVSSDHPLLGREVQLAGIGVRVFQTTVAPDRPEFLVDHCVNGNIVFPAAGFLEMALAAGVKVFQAPAITLSRVNFLRPLVLKADDPFTLQLTAHPSSDSEGWRFEIHARPRTTVEPGGWQKLAEGLFCATTAPEDTAQSERVSDSGNGVAGTESFYHQLQQRGLDYGPAFRSVTHVSGDGEGRAAASVAHAGAGDPYLFHPALLDGVLQTVAAATTESPLPHVPFHLERLELWRPAGDEVRSQTVATQTGTSGSGIRVDYSVSTRSGEAVARFTGMILKPLSAESLRDKPGGDFGKWLYQSEWRRATIEKPGDSLTNKTGTTLILAGDPDLAAGLAGELRPQRSTVILALPGRSFRSLTPDTYEVRPEDAGDLQALLAAAFANRLDSPVEIVHALSVPSVASEFDPADVSEFELAQRLGYDSILTLARLAGAMRCRLVLVTQGSQSVGGEARAPRPEQSPVWGLGRVLRLELPAISCRLVDLDPDTLSVEQVVDLAREVTANDREDDVAIRGRTRWFARITSSPTGGQEGLRPIFRLGIGTYGDLDTLRFEPSQRRDPADHEVEVAVEAAGLNFRDVLHALGRLPETAGTMPFGFEAAGRVTAIGRSVTRVAVGDPVVVGSTVGSMGSHTIAHEAFVARKPERLSSAEAAVLPLAYLTAYYGLHVLAGLKPGERVLIHAAAGGVGMAAIQLCQRIGAEIHATASPGKWEHLKALGVLHLYNSRTLDFAAQVRDRTGGIGVDLVLNSLNGEFIPASLQAVRLGGRFVEIGKIGVWSPEQVSQTRPDVAYFPFDLSDVTKVEPALTTHMLDSILGWVADGSLSPLPVRAFPREQAVAAFRWMSQARHIGKVAVTIAPPASRGPVADGTYLVTGGLGGLGLTVAKALARAGAGRLVLTSRRPPSETASESLRSIQASGAEVCVRLADVADSSQIVALVAEFRNHPRPLRGIIHAAGVLEDATLTQQTPATYRSVLRPKAAGVFALHAATEDLPLDFFVCFSSGTAIVGALGQANYSAANAVLDAFVQWRRYRGLPGLSINWGLWADVGMGSTLDPRALERLEHFGTLPLPQEQAIAALHHLLHTNVAQAAVMGVDWSRLLTQYDPSRTPQIYAELLAPTPAVNGRAAAATEDWRTVIRALPVGEGIPTLAELVRREAARVIGLHQADDLDPQVEFAQVGFDSLAGVELATRIGQRVGRPMAPTLVFDYPTVGRLARYLYDSVIGANGSTPGPGSPTPPQLHPDSPSPTTVAAARSNSPTPHATPNTNGRSLAVERSTPASIHVRTPDSPEAFPLSFAQERIWVAEQVTRVPHMFTEFLTLRLRGQLSVDNLARSAQAILDREESLRVSISRRDGQLIQAVRSGMAVPFDLVDVRSEPEHERERKVKNHVSKVIRQVFSLDQPPLFRMTLIRDEEHAWVIILTAHHIVLDATSFAHLIYRLFDYYERFRAGLPLPPHSQAVSLCGHVRRERDWIDQRGYRQQLDYWVRELHGLGSGTELLGDFPRPALPSGAGATSGLELDETVIARLKKVAENHNVTLSTVLLAGLNVFLQQHTGAGECVIGLPVANRNRPGLADAAGMFVNMLTLRIPMSPEDTFADLLGTVRQRTLDVYRNQDVPFQHVVEAVKPRRDPSRAPFFQIVFDFQRPGDRPIPPTELEAELYPVENGTAKYDLCFGLREITGRVFGELVYRTDLYTAATADGFFKEYFQILIDLASRDQVGKWLVQGPTGEVGSRSQGRGLIVLPPAWSGIHSAVEEWAVRQPHAPAIIGDSETLSYARLNGMANRFGGYLASRGVGPGQVVGVRCGRSAAHCLSILGVVKTGAAYLPIDQASPPERVRHMLTDAGCRLLIVGSSADDPGAPGVPSVTFDEVVARLAAYPDSNPQITVGPDDPVYIIYTSGSTGVPNGVEVPHRGLVNLVTWHRRAFEVSPGDVASMLAGVGFDASAWEFWAALASGAAVRPANESVLPTTDSFARWLVTQKITVAFVPTPLAEPAFDFPWPPDTRLRVMLTGGDRLGRSPPRTLPFAVYNNYGPTEYSVVATSGPVVPGSAGSPSIGSPIDNTRIVLLSPSGTLVPPGVVGEIAISGPGLARRYVGRPDLTNERFVTLPSQEGSPTHAYRTGDLARWLPNGSLDFVGRADDQVKIRGYRVELREIEEVLRQAPGVRNAAVCVVGERADERHLVAFSVGAGVNPAGLKEYLRTRLPGYMVPRTVGVIDELPLTINGKVDRKQLLSIIHQSHEPPQLPPATSERRAVLAAIFAEVLSVARIEPAENFFDLGGHSLLVIRLAEAIRSRLGVEVQLRDLFLNPTVEGIDRLLDHPTSTETLPDCLMTLYPGNGGDPLFLVCPASGSPMCYRELAAELGPDRPVYGLQSPGLGEGEAPCQTVGELAAHFLQAIQQVSPTGPLLLGGWSFGGLVALELARLLAACGRQAQVFLLDVGLPPEGQRSVQEGETWAGLSEALRNVGRLPVPTSYGDVRRLVGWAGISLPHTFRGLVWRGPKSQFRFLSEIVRGGWRSFRLFRTHYRAARRYNLKPVGCRAVLFRTGLRGERADEDPVVRRLRQVVGESLEVVPTPGNHMTILDGENRRVLAQAMRTWLDGVALTPDASDRRRHYQQEVGP